MAWRTSTQLAAAVQQQLIPASQRRVVQVIPVGGADTTSTAHRQHRQELSPPLSPSVPVPAPPQHPPDGDDTAVHNSCRAEEKRDDDVELHYKNMFINPPPIIPKTEEEEDDYIEEYSETCTVVSEIHYNTDDDYDDYNYEYECDNDYEDIDDFDEDYS